MALLTAHETARMLGVKIPTIYAYVSRGVLKRHLGPDGKSSLFDARQVESLARRGRPRLSTQPGSVHIPIESALTAIGDDGVYFRGHAASELLQNYSFEEVTQLLWTGTLPPHPDGSECGDPWLPMGPVVRSGSLPQKLRAATVRSIAENSSWMRPSSLEAAKAGRALLQAMVGALPVLGERSVAELRLGGRGELTRNGGRSLLTKPASRVVSSSLAAHLWPRLTAEPATAEWIFLLNALLVLLADHELASSTLAVRIAASTHASPGAAVLAGLGVMEGPLHGAASRFARDLIFEADSVGAECAVRRRVKAGERIPGFGHRVYPRTDPRAVVVSTLLRSIVPMSRPLVLVDDLARAVQEHHPNIDLLLAAVELAAGMKRDASEAIFSVARTAGWIAHAIEEYEQPPLRFRARAQYVGPKVM